MYFKIAQWWMVVNYDCFQNNNGHSIMDHHNFYLKKYYSFSDNKFHYRLKGLNNKTYKCLSEVGLNVQNGKLNIEEERKHQHQVYTLINVSYTDVTLKEDPIKQDTVYTYVMPTRFQKDRIAYDIYSRSKNAGGVVHGQKLIDVEEFLIEINNYSVEHTEKLHTYVKDDKITTLESLLKELKLDVNVRVPTLHNRVEELETNLVKFIESSTQQTQKHNDDLSNLTKKLSDHVAVCNNNFEAFDVHFRKCNEFRQNVEHKIVDIYEQIENSDDDVSEQSDDDKTNLLTPQNLLTEAVTFVKLSETQKSLDIVETIKSMLSSSRYILSDDFKKNKLDLKDIQFKFKLMTSPQTITRDEILAEVFDIDNTVSFI
jgi:hypothetical protein